MTDRKTLGSYQCAVVVFFIHVSANGSDGAGFEECRSLRFLMFTSFFCWSLRSHLPLVLKDMDVNEHMIDYPTLQ
jgi:hypothetical protein